MISVPPDLGEFLALAPRPTLGRSLGALRQSSNHVLSCCRRSGCVICLQKFSRISVATGRPAPLGLLTETVVLGMCAFSRVIALCPCSFALWVTAGPGSQEEQACWAPRGRAASMSPSWPLRRSSPSPSCQGRAFPSGRLECLDWGRKVPLLSPGVLMLQPLVWPSDQHPTVSGGPFPSLGAIRPLEAFSLGSLLFMSNILPEAHPPLFSPGSCGGYGASVARQCAQEGPS